MTCPGPDVDQCTDATPCRTCPAVCPFCGDTWQAHVEGIPCSEPRYCHRMGQNCTGDCPNCTSTAADAAREET